ncbi:MAG: AraC family transcriptional regulator, partial [Calothrix sp. FI2-JRJ7]|nr:AraC family transcriptional regulator [Calothrix sp. FI2-JRJ7]
SLQTIAQTKRFSSRFNKFLLVASSDSCSVISFFMGKQPDMILHRYSSKKNEISNYSGGLPSHQLQKSIDYMQYHLSEDISLEDIAAYVGISQYYFVRLFKQSTGYSPYQYLIKCRIERAKQLMMLRQGSITDIAVLVGFTSQSQFGRHFKRFTGMTPKQFFNK